MVAKSGSFLHGQSFFKRVVGFIVALGAIASALLAINQLINLFGNHQESYNPPGTTNSDIDNNNRTVNKKDNGSVYNQNSIGNNNRNNWNNY